MKAKTTLDSIKEDAPAAENEIINNHISQIRKFSEIRQASELSMKSITQDGKDGIQKHH